MAKDRERQLQPETNDPLYKKIKGINFKFGRVADWTKKKIQSLLNDRSEWHEMRKEYMPQFEDLMSSNTQGPFPGSASFNVPITMWMLRQMHARIMAALIGDEYGFTTVPEEKVSRSLAEEIDRTMRWAVTSYANEWQGIHLDIDDWVWDVCKEGWGVLKRRWDVVDTKVALTEEELSRINESRTTQEVLDSMIQVMNTFDGPRIETVDHEAILFPGKMQNGMDLNQPPLVTHLIFLTRNDIIKRIKTKLWDKETAEKILKHPTKNSSGDYQYDDVQRMKEAFQGVKTISTQDEEDQYPVYEAYARYDVDNDDFDENVVYWYHSPTNSIPRWTTIDRVSPKTLKRPLHKADFLRRQRRGYGMGMAQILYSIQREVNAMHNQRIDFGTLASIPFFFFKPASGIKKQKILLEPGMGVPLDNPQTDVNFPRFNTNVLFTKNEEASLIQFAEKLLSLPPITNGQSPSPAGPTMHATGFVGLLNEIGVDFDVVLKHFKVGYEQMLKGLHADLEQRMPTGYKFRVLGTQNQELLDENGQPQEMRTNRFNIMAEVSFKIKANSRTLNREMQKQDAMALLSVIMNPLLIQTGIVTPNNLYNGVDNVLAKRGELDMTRYITAPQMSEQPMTALGEIVMITQGQMPKIMLNDDHAAKVTALEAYVQSEGFAQAWRNRAVAMEAPDLFQRAIKRHKELADAMSTQAGLQNATGSQMPLSMGARLSGEVNQQTGESLASQQISQAQNQSQATQDVGTINQTFGRPT